MIAISITVTGDKELASRLTPRVVAEPKRRFLTKSTFLIEGRAKANVPPNIDTGAGMNSIQGKVSGDTGTVEVGEEHMIFVHEGTKPHWPPIAAIAPWAQRHGIDPFLVAKGIAEHGTKANPFLSDAFEQSLGEINGYVSDMAREIERALAG